MKRTTFEVDVQLTSEEPDAQFTSIADQLSKLAGVKEVTSGPGSEYRKLSILAEFSDTSEAKKIHSKVMSLLSKTPDLSIMGISTNLSDVFG